MVGIRQDEEQFRHRLEPRNREVLVLRSLNLVQLVTIIVLTLSRHHTALLLQRSRPGRIQALSRAMATAISP